MASAHAFMDLDPSELGYFITQVGLAATSFGVSTEDVTAVADALKKLFGYRCSPPTVVIPEQGKTLNSICQNEKCQLDPMPMCAAYLNNGTVSGPKTASVALSSSTIGHSTGMASATGKPSSTTSGLVLSTGAAGNTGVGAGAIVGALVFGLVL